MRKTSYVVSLIAVSAVLVLSLLSGSRRDWIVVKSPKVLNAQIVVRYGLTQKCERSIIDIPSGNGHIRYTDYTCRPFPSQKDDSCRDQEGINACAEWSTASYLIELAMGLSGVSMLSLLFGISTHSRRRRVWRAVASLVIASTTLQIIAFALITDAYMQSRYPTWDQGRLGSGYILQTLSWITGVFIAIGLVSTGMSADKGHHWAAGNRAYRPISD